MSLPLIHGQSSIDNSVAALSGTMAAGLGADSEVFQFRWTSTTTKAVIHSVSIDGMGGSATAFTAGFAKFALFIARSWTAVGTGGNAFLPTGDIASLRTANAVTQVNDIRCASTTNLGAGTKTLDTIPVGQYSFTVGTAVSTQYINNRIFLFQSSEYRNSPIILAANEGIAITATVPATGTWQFGASVQWAETV